MNEKRDGHWLTQWAQPLAVVVAVLAAVVGATYFVVGELARLDQSQADIKAELVGLTDLGKNLEERWETRLNMLETRLDERWETRLSMLETRLEERWETRLSMLETRLDERWETRLGTLDTRLGTLFADLRDELRDGRRLFRARSTTPRKH